MKALTLTQPWATLVAIGAKRIETRSWFTAHRGKLAIHAAKGMPAEAKMLCNTEPFRTLLKGAGIDRINDLPRGAVVALVQLVDVAPMSATVNSSAFPGWRWNAQYLIYRWPLTPQERELGHYAPGRYAWLLDDVWSLNSPIPAKGSLGLWNWPGEQPLSTHNNSLSDQEPTP